MSIPPLVCSTPPPPDQCEDDKDHDDYELQYNSSQEEDDNNDYDFGNYPNYEQFQTHELNKQEKNSTNNLSCEESQVIEITTDKISISSEKENGSDNTHRTKDTSEIKLGHDDDFDIEDLDLKIDNESSSSSGKDNSSCDEISKQENSISVTSEDVVKTSESADENSCLSRINTEPEAVEPFDNPTTKLNVFENNKFQGQFKDIGSNDNIAKQIDHEKIIEKQIVEADFDESTNVLEGATDADFGDFDKFQFSAPEDKTKVVLESYENPWSEKTTDNTEFGEFTATFDNNYTSCQNTLSQVISDENHSEPKELDLHDDDDSFGDFDEFQSSANQNDTTEVLEKEYCDAVPVLNLQSIENDAQVMDSINKVLTSLFNEEISEPVSQNDLRLESLLSETWGHLTETDVRQPYIIHWNSSLGQKTLLKALCIDSRNILFGPKWSHNMPKYAANLTSAPLQPQKQVSNTPQTDITCSDQATNKPNNWSDPFSANGQQSCSTEKEGNVVEPRPTDLDVFEAAISTKSDKIYSSTINVQPIRQINLPDTHIFTPTDSETPRSKTIHYDSIPTILLPQAIIDKNENHVQIVKSQSSCHKPNKVEDDDGDHHHDDNDDDDYWEFQEFKTPTPTINTLTEIQSQTGQSVEKSNEIVTINNPLPKPRTAYQTELLQPIKIEPAIPTLNWPDPGEVKEEFDTFTEFASTSSWIDQNPINSQIESVKPININNTTSENSNEQKNIHEIEINSTNKITLDDDFDTFQSALPSITNTIDFNRDSLSNGTRNKSLTHNKNHLDYDHSILNESSVKTDTISIESTTKSNESSAVAFKINTAESTDKNVPTIGTQLHMNLLQPMAATSTATVTSNQQKTGQILQPLSLESYSQINWPSPGIDLQDLSRFNPVETLHSLKSDLSVSGQSKGSPIHSSKLVVNTHVQEDDVWGEFVSSKPTPPQPQMKNQTTFGDDDEWTDFVSSPSVKPHNGLNTISLNVHTNSNMQKTTSQSKFTMKNNQMSLDIPTLNYITPKTNNHKSYNDRHFQNL